MPAIQLPQRADCQTLAICSNQEPNMILESVLTCPECGMAKAEPMPTDACQYFYECSGCGAVLRPKAGDCCVFCSYGSVPCPPVQEQRSQMGAAAACCGKSL